MRRLPPWLGNRENDCLQHSPRLYANGSVKADANVRGMSSVEVVENRLEHVSSAVDIAESLFGQPDFNRALNRFAQDRNLIQTRLRRWVICYLAFGCNRWALLPPTDPIAFEQWVADGLKRDGYIVTMTPVSGDYGVDVVADTKLEARFAVANEFLDWRRS